MRSETLRKRLLLPAVLLGIILLIVLAAVLKKKNGSPAIGEAGSAETEWAVYWYLCGSNLETDSESATKDLQEMLSTEIPENVKVIIEAGGAKKWHTKGLDPEKITRLLYDGKRLTTLSVLPDTNMGESSTLSDFLAFCQENYPARHTMLILWDHGGGSLAGVCYDQNHGMDCLSYPELSEAFLMLGGGKLDIIGFDACLMSSVDTVSACRDAASYMIASQQLEPVCGWDYRHLMECLGNPADLSAETLGKAICDGYLAGCEREGLAESATLSLLDLSKAGALLTAYEEKLLLSFDRVLLSDADAATLRRSALEAENYGTNGTSVGFTDMVDLRGYLGTEIPADTDALSPLIGEAVLYQVRGSGFPRGCGISCYYPLDASLRSVLQFTGAAKPPEDISLFYRYMIQPDLTDPVSSYAERRNISENDIMKNRFRASALELSENPLVPADGGRFSLSLPADTASQLSGASLRIIGAFEVENTLFNDGDTMFFLMEEGEVPAEKADFATGDFLFDGTGKLVTLDGVSFATYVASDDAGHTVLTCPAVIGDRDGVLFFSRSKTSGDLSFLGAYPGTIHRTGQYSMAGFLSEEESGSLDAAGYAEEAVSEKEPFDYTFTFDELYEYHEKFGNLDDPGEIEAYLHEKSGEPESDEAAANGDQGDGMDYVFARLSPLTPGELLTPIYRCVYSQTLSDTSWDTAVFANWETTETISYRDNGKLTYEAGHYSSEYPRTGLYSYTLSDAWGNTVSSRPVLGE